MGELRKVNFRGKDQALAVAHEKRSTYGQVY